MSEISGLRRPKGNSEYLPNLDQLLSQCELNYLLAQRAWPKLFEMRSEFLDSKESKKSFAEVGAEAQLFAENNAVCLIGEITNIEKYTTTLDLTIKRPSKVDKKSSAADSVNETKSEGLTKPTVLIVRLYHDAKMMEVMEGTGPGSLKAIYKDDNSTKQSDEKRQANRFVGECLRASLAKA